jgi:hypothetical protein
MFDMPKIKTLPSSRNKTVTRSFRLEPELDALLEAKARKMERSVSWLINSALECALIGKDEALARSIFRSFSKQAPERYEQQ